MAGAVEEAIRSSIEPGERLLTPRVEEPFQSRGTPATRWFSSLSRAAES